MVALQRKHEALAECIASMRLAASRGAGGATWALRVRRGMIMSSVVEAFLAVDVDAVDAVRGVPRTSALLKRARVSFVGEAGVDAGGLTAEMYQCFFEALVAQSGARGGGTRCPLFECADGDGVVAPAFLPARFAAGASDAPAGALAPDDAVRLLEGVGRVLVKSVYDRQPVPAPFAPSLFKFLLGVRPNLHDLEVRSSFRLFAPILLFAHLFFCLLSTTSRRSIPSWARAAGRWWTWRARSEATRSRR